MIMSKLPSGGISAPIPQLVNGRWKFVRRSVNTVTDLKHSNRRNYHIMSQTIHANNPEILMYKDLLFYMCGFRAYGSACISSEYTSGRDASPILRLGFEWYTNNNGSGDVSYPFVEWGMNQNPSGYDNWAQYDAVKITPHGLFMWILPGGIYIYDGQSSDAQGAQAPIFYHGTSLTKPHEIAGITNIQNAGTQYETVTFNPDYFDPGKGTMERNTSFRGPFGFGSFGRTSYAHTYISTVTLEMDLYRFTFESD